MMGSTTWAKKALRMLVIVAFWLAIWKIVSLFAPKMLFASPLQTAQALVRLLPQSDFWLSIGGTLLKTAAGFFLALLAAAGLAVCSFRMPFIRMLLEPAVQVMKSVPVACFAIVALIWITSATISVLVSFFVVFPLTYINLLTALDALDRPLTEMAVVFRVPLARRIAKVYLPQLIPAVRGTLRVAVGMCWKASIAGEIIGLPLHSIGEQLYLSKLYLSMDELFAWTVVIVLISFLLERGAIFLLGRLPAGRREENE